MSLKNATLKEVIENRIIKNLKVSDFEISEKDDNKFKYKLIIRRSISKEEHALILKVLFICSVNGEKIEREVEEKIELNAIDLRLGPDVVQHTLIMMALEKTTKIIRDAIATKIVFKKIDINKLIEWIAFPSSKNNLQIKNWENKNEPKPKK
jgi:hypothetical protein